ncbi:hypothetical protein HOG98_06560 [bacterium]|jgi:hypothetical protein|nr:hypothetical protein [bacterium]
MRNRGVSFKVIALSLLERGGFETTLSDESFVRVYEKIERKFNHPILSSLMSDKVQEDSSKRLYNNIRNYLGSENSRPYTENLNAFLHAYDVYHAYLEKTDFPEPETFKRNLRVIHFCRALVCEPVHPLLEYSKIQNNYKSNSSKIELLHDSLAVLITMDAIIDDCADKLTNEMYVNKIGSIYRNSTYEQMSFKSEEERVAFSSLFEMADTLWKQAMSLLGECCGIENVEQDPLFISEMLPTFDSVLKTMKDSIKASDKGIRESWLNSPDSCNEALEKFSPGMMIDVFFEGQLLVLRHLGLIDSDVDPLTESNEDLRRLFSNVKVSAAKMARLSNDLGSFEKDFGEKCRTNSLFFLCHDLLLKNGEGNEGVLERLLDDYYETRDIEIKKKIHSLADKEKVFDSAFEIWNDQLQVVENAARESRLILPGASGIRMEQSFYRLADGCKQLLIMYLIMAEFKGGV